MPPSKRLAFDITDKVLSSGDQSSDPEENVVDCDNWKNNPPTIQDFPFNERPGLKICIPDNASPMFFFGLILTDEFVESLVLSIINAISIQTDCYDTDLHGTLGQMSTFLI